MGHGRRKRAKVRELVIQPMNGETATHICSILPRQLSPCLTKRETVPKVSARTTRSEWNTVGRRATVREGTFLPIRSGRPSERQRISGSPTPFGKNRSLLAFCLRWAFSNIVQHRTRNYGREKKPEWWASVRLEELGKGD